MKGYRKLIGLVIVVVAGCALQAFGALNEVAATFLVSIYLGFCGFNGAEHLANRWRQTPFPPLPRVGRGGDRPEERPAAPAGEEVPNVRRALDAGVDLAALRAEMAAMNTRSR